MRESDGARMNGAGRPGSPEAEDARERSAFELLGLVPAPASPDPRPSSAPVPPLLVPSAAVPPVPLPSAGDALPVSVVPLAAQLPSAAPLSRREAREIAAREAARGRRGGSRRRDRAHGSAAPEPASASRRAAPPTARLSRRPARSAAPRRRDRVVAPRAPRKSFGARLLSFGAMVLAGAFLVGLTVPANAFYGAGSPVGAAQLVSAEGVQTLEVGDTVVAASGTERSAWGVTSWAEILRQQYGAVDYSYTVGTGAIRWPFPFPVPITDGFGYRVAPCRGCSTNHQGVDFIPGYGQPIYAVADGVVTVSEVHWSYGTTIEIEHEIDGQVVTSKYAHMQSGSTPLKPGDVVEVGDFVGLVGSTGVSTGPHLHLEIWLDGIKVNPFTWLKAKAS